MDRKFLTQLFADTTQLTQQQIKALATIILEYDEVEELAYEAVGQLNNGITFKQLKHDYTNGNFGWKGTAFKECQLSRKFRDQMLETPPEVREGEMECPHCHLTKTLVVETQQRSADEGFTYYIHCLNQKCGQITKT